MTNHMEAFGYENLAQLLRRHVGAAHVAPLFLANRALVDIWRRERRSLTEEILQAHRSFETGPVDGIAYLLATLVLPDASRPGVCVALSPGTRGVVDALRRFRESSALSKQRAAASELVGALEGSRFGGVAVEVSDAGVFLTGVGEPLKMWKEWTIGKEEPAGWPRDDVFVVTPLEGRARVGSNERFLCETHGDFARARRGVVLSFDF